MRKVKKYMPNANLFDLANGGPEAALLQFKDVRCRILACGGDGTAAWILNCIDNIKYRGDKIPAVAILPLGTGNDLSRVLRWGGAYSPQKISQLMPRIERACVVAMDRWTVQIGATSRDIRVGDAKGKDPEPGGAHHIGRGDQRMTNYFSIGVDAHVALGFHEKRQAHPEKFNNRIQNLAWYAHIGVQKTFKAFDLRPHLEIEVDGRPIRLPANLRALLVLNIPSYSGGGVPWGDPKRKQKKGVKYAYPAIDDGVFEVVGIMGALGMATITAKLGRGKRLAQGRSIKITTNRGIPAQIDGEPWFQDPAVITISHAGTALVLANSPPSILVNQTDLDVPIDEIMGGSLPGSPANAKKTPAISGSRLEVIRDAPNPVRRTISLPSTPVVASPAPPINHGPVPLEKRKKGRHYCDGCHLEFFLPYMLSNHLESGLCPAATAASPRSTPRASATSSPAISRSASPSAAAAAPAVVPALVAKKLIGSLAKPQRANTEGQLAEKQATLFSPRSAPCTPAPERAHTSLSATSSAGSSPFSPRRVDPDAKASVSEAEPREGESSTSPQPECSASPATTHDEPSTTTTTTDEDDDEGASSAKSVPPFSAPTEPIPDQEAKPVAPEERDGADLPHHHLGAADCQQESTMHQPAEDGFGAEIGSE